MRDDHKLTLKKLTLQINSFALRHGHKYTGNYWANNHIPWLRNLALDPSYQEPLDEYMASYDEQEAKI